MIHQFVAEVKGSADFHIFKEVFGRGPWLVFATNDSAHLLRQIGKIAEIYEVQKYASSSSGNDGHPRLFRDHYFCNPMETSIENFKLFLTKIRHDIEQTLGVEQISQSFSQMAIK
jgi:hypothetical protein